VWNIVLPSQYYDEAGEEADSMEMDYQTIMDGKARCASYTAELKNGGVDYTTL